MSAPSSKSDTEMILCMNDLRDAATSRLPVEARGKSHRTIGSIEDWLMDRNPQEFYNSGSDEQITVRENTTAYGKYRLRPRVLVDVSESDTTTSVFGRQIDFPLCVSPTGLQAMAHPDGELATTRACAKRNINMGVSSFTNTVVEAVRAAALKIAPIEHAMQLYSMKDRVKQEALVKRAEAAGVKAIFLTADSPVLGVRYNEVRNDFRTPSGLDFPMLGWTSEEIRSRTHDNSFTAFNSDAHSWLKEIPWLRSITKMEIWIKGILTAEDVLLAREYGCDGVVISNHGGRQLDGVPATIDALPECVAAADGKIKVHIDGGIRSGADIFKALALGAECCWVGRPVIWGLAYDGEAGVTKMLDMLHTEFRRCMLLAGCRTVSDITKASLGVVRQDGPLARL